ncbi:MAG: S41 family peptidase [Polyangiaceae bacterium]|nr:S41 family peptidase [Polyangiaceae bacterium]
MRSRFSWLTAPLLAVPLLATPLLVAAGCSTEEIYGIPAPEDCSIEAQNAFAYQLMTEAYLWNDFVPDEILPEDYDSPNALVRDLRYAEFDIWSSVGDLVTVEAYYEEGVVVGYGFSAQFTEEDRLTLASVDEESPAGEAGLKRGDQIIGFNGKSLQELIETNGFQEAFGPQEPGIELTVQRLSSTGEEEELILIKDEYPLVTVPTAELIDTDDGPVGHLVFSNFLEPTTEELDQAFEVFQTAQVEQLVIDFRYNGGGRLSVAEYLLNLIVGADASRQVAYSLEHNQNLQDADTSTLFSSEAFSLQGVEEIVFITSPSTASASELVVNALEPYLDVMVVGTPSAGKPVGSAAWQFCDKIAQPITFRIVNSEGEGDYFDGLPVDCSAPDDVSKELFDPEEASLQAALALLDDAPCPDFSDVGEGGEQEPEPEQEAAE